MGWFAWFIALATTLTSSVAMDFLHWSRSPDVCQDRRHYSNCSRNMRLKQSRFHLELDCLRYCFSYFEFDAVFHSSSCFPWDEISLPILILSRCSCCCVVRILFCLWKWNFEYSLISVSRLHVHFSHWQQNSERTLFVSHWAWKATLQFVV